MGMTMLAGLPQGSLANRHSNDIHRMSTRETVPVALVAILAKFPAPAKMSEPHLQRILTDSVQAALARVRGCDFGSSPPAAS